MIAFPLDIIVQMRPTSHADVPNSRLVKKGVGKVVM